MKLLSLIGILLISNLSWGCDFSTDVKKMTDGTYSYSRDCHIEVGNLIEDNKIKSEQIKLLNKSIELKDLVIGGYEKRLNLWMETTEKLEQRLYTIEKYNSTQKWLHFGLGIAVSGLAVYGASKIVK